MVKKVTTTKTDMTEVGPLREVPAVKVVAWLDGYEYIRSYAPEMVMRSIIVALDQGYTPEEIEKQLKRDLPAEKERVAISARNAAYHILYSQGEVEP